MQARFVPRRRFCWGLGRFKSEHMVECAAYLVILLLYPFRCHARNRRHCHTEVISLFSGFESGRITCVKVLG